MLRTKVLRCIAVELLAFLAATPAHADTTHQSKTVAEIQPPQAGVDCLFFRLTGVAQADPIQPNNPYFALPRTHVGFKEIYALMLAAYMSGTPVSVKTSGAPAGGVCGGYVGTAWFITG